MKSKGRIMQQSLPTLALLITSAFAFADTASISGTVTDAATDDSIAFANILVANQAGAKIGGSSSDLDGHYIVNALASGTYTVSCSASGKTTTTVDNVVVSAGENKTIDCQLQ